MEFLVFFLNCFDLVGENKRKSIALKYEDNQDTILCVSENHAQVSWVGNLIR